MTQIAVPDSLQRFAGRILDCDSHEQMPAQVWVEHFGEVARPFAEIMMQSPPTNPNHSNVAGYAGDTREISAETIWSVKGPTSPGAVDAARRPEILDTMGVSRQLMFPTSIGLWGGALYTAPEESSLYAHFKENTRSYAEKLFAANNDWAVRAAQVSPRIRPVTPLFGETPAAMLACAQKLLASGIRAVSVPSAIPPADISPAHPDFDPLYALLAEANVPLTLHLGTELIFFRTDKWRAAPAFEGYKVNEELSMDPWWLSVMHIPAQNFLGTLINGGVFHRHPNLRFGVLECGAHWVGPLAKLLDVWYDNNQSTGLKDWGDSYRGRRMPLRPSEYIARNVRVNPYDFEPIDEYIDRYGLEDVFCFGSDYPHVEGGKDPMGRLAGRLERLGPRMLEKFFVTNGEWLLPN
ncbi:MAG: amidohydrolase family protein [Steroidobacteraceae bacterium]